MVSSVNSISAPFNFASPEDSIYYDDRVLSKKITDKTISVFREISYIYKNLKGQAVDYFNPTFDHVNETKSWKAESRGLYLFIHGLNGHPVTWTAHLNQLKNELDIDLFVPYVPLRGNGPLEEVATPILNVVKDYALKNPTRPICLIGVSNGGRICTWLETQLRTIIPSTPIRVSTIAAVHFGSGSMAHVKRCRELTGKTFGYHTSIINDLSFGSEKAKEILTVVSKSLPPGVIREYEFFGSTEDSHVEVVSAIPDIEVENAKMMKHKVHGYNHGGIIEGVSENQMQSCKQWMHQFKPNLPPKS